MENEAPRYPQYMSQLSPDERTFIQSATSEIPFYRLEAQVIPYAILDRGTINSYIVEWRLGESFYLRGSVVRAPFGPVVFLDAKSQNLLAQFYTDERLDRYNAGHDPRYRGM